MQRVARLLLLAVLLAPTLLRRLPASVDPPCEPAGRGSEPRRWLGCVADGGPSRDLAGDERLLLGLPLDVNRATARELAFVPGLTPSLAAEVVADRARGGPFGTVADLVRVHGIGPRRLARAQPWLEAGAPADAVAAGAK